MRKDEWWAHNLKIGGSHHPGRVNSFFLKKRNILHVSYSKLHSTVLQHLIWGVSRATVSCSQINYTQTLDRKPACQKSSLILVIHSYNYFLAWVIVILLRVLCIFFTNPWITIRGYCKNAFTSCPISNVYLLVMVQACVHTLHTKIKSYHYKRKVYYPKRSCNFIL